MIPITLKNDRNLDSLLNYIEWKYDGSEAPGDRELCAIGQLVMENVISTSNCKIGNVLVEFNVYHEGAREIPPAVKSVVYAGLVGADKDFLVLEATVSWEPRLDGTNYSKVRKVEEIQIYNGYSFKELWAAWRSWILAGRHILHDLAEYTEEIIRQQREEAERNGTGLNAG
jgi:hypothetical protein